MIELKDIFTIEEADLLYLLSEELKDKGYEPVSHKDDYVWATGSIPIMLVAHVDTVGDADAVFHDHLENVFWSPDGLGADDRAGVWGILYLLEKGYRPSILFTNGEESGGWGASSAKKKLAQDVGDVRVIVEIDRQGEMEAVFYSCGSEKIREWVEGVGFKKDFGTFSDISILGPAWDIAAVNLSAGYYMEHSRAEFLVVDHLMSTLAAVEKLLKDPPKEVWPHETDHAKGWRTTQWSYTSRREEYNFSFDNWSEKYGGKDSDVDDDWGDWVNDGKGGLVHVDDLGEDDEPIEYKPKEYKPKREADDHYSDAYVSDRDGLPIPCDFCGAEITDAPSLHLRKDGDGWTWILCETCDRLWEMDGALWQ